MGIHNIKHSDLHVTVCVCSEGSALFHIKLFVSPCPIWNKPNYQQTGPDMCPSLFMVKALPKALLKSRQVKCEIISAGLGMES